MCKYPTSVQFVGLWNAWNRCHGNGLAVCVYVCARMCACGAVNIDFTTSPSLCLSVTGALGQRRGGGGRYTLFIQDSAKSCYRGRVFTSRPPNTEQLFGCERFTV